MKVLTDSNHTVEPVFSKVTAGLYEVACRGGSRARESVGCGVDQWPVSDL